MQQRRRQPVEEVPVPLIARMVLVQQVAPPLRGRVRKLRGIQKRCAAGVTTPVSERVNPLQGPDVAGTADGSVHGTASFRDIVAINEWHSRLPGMANWESKKGTSKKGTDLFSKINLSPFPPFLMWMPAARRKTTGFAALNPPYQ
jgi:hypothetical protein